MTSIRQYVRVPLISNTQDKSVKTAATKAAAPATDTTAVARSLNAVIRSIIEANRQAQIAEEEIEQSNLSPMTASLPAFEADALADAAAALKTGIAHLENAAQMFKASRQILSQAATEATEEDSDF